MAKYVRILYVGFLFSRREDTANGEVGMLLCTPTPSRGLASWPLVVQENARFASRRHGSWASIDFSQQVAVQSCLCLDVIAPG